MCVWGVLPAWSPLQNVHQSVTNKSAESVPEIAPSFPGLRSHLSPLGQGFGTFATHSLHSNMLQRGILCTWGRLLWYAGGGEQQLKSNSIFMCHIQVPRVEILNALNIQK